MHTRKKHYCYVLVWAACDIVELRHRSVGAPKHPHSVLSIPNIVGKVRVVYICLQIDSFAESPSGPRHIILKLDVHVNHKATTKAYASRPREVHALGRGRQQETRNKVHVRQEKKPSKSRIKKPHKETTKSTRGKPAAIVTEPRP